MHGAFQELSSEDGETKSNQHSSCCPCTPKHGWEPQISAHLCIGPWICLTAPLAVACAVGHESRELGAGLSPCSTLCRGGGSVCCVGLSCPLPADVDVISKFAQLEFQLGDAERAKAIFENTLSTYPKRTDVWSVYIDMTIKHGSQKEVR